MAMWALKIPEVKGEMRPLRAPLMAMTLAAVAGLSISALAGSYTTQDLLNDCHGQNKSFCLGYLAGAAGILFEMHDNGVDTVPTKQENVRVVVSACAVGITFGAMRQAFINWAEKNPRDWGFSANNGAMLALQATWPCTK
jgi:hypothetical protein